MARQLVIELVGKADKYVKSLDDAEKASKSFGDKVEGAGKKMSLFATVPIVGFLAAGTKAAMDDAAAQDHLARTLANTTGSSKALVTQVEGFIEAAQKVSTFTDDQLRPAFESLVTVTHNAEDANKLLTIAMDVAAAKNIDLQTASMAVAKAHEGNFAAVNKLVPGLVDVKDKTLTVDQAMGQLSATFKGQAQGATETTAGKMQMLRRDIGEAGEAMGTKLLPAITGFANFATGTLLPTLDKLSGGNGAFVLLGVAAAGPVLSHIGKLKTAIVELNLSLDATAVKAAAALGAIGIVVGGATDLAHDITEAFKSDDKLKGFLNAVLGGGADTGIFGKKNLGLRAAGGPVTAGSPYVVGEKGPELFVPRSSGSIVPNGGGAQSVVVNMHVYGSVLKEYELVEMIRTGLLRKQRTTPLGFAT